MSFLRSLAYAGLTTVLLSGTVTVVLLPALLVLCLRHAPRSRLTRLPRPLRRTGLWGRWAYWVMRHPFATAVPAVAVLLFCASPFLNARFGLDDYQALPAQAPARQAATALKTDFPELDRPTIEIAITDASPHEVTRFSDTVSSYPGVYEVDTLRGKVRGGHQYYGVPVDRTTTDKNVLYQIRQASRVSRGTTRILAPEPDRHKGNVNWVTVKLDVGRYSDVARQLVDRISAGSKPPGTLIGGDPADLVDTLNLISGHLLPAAAVITVSVLLLLFLFTGSILVPLKALVLNALSLSASFGAIVYIFQEGHLKWLVGDFTTTGYLSATVPVLLLCVAFGLSMDYEILLLSRIRESYDLGGDNKAAIADGLQRTGKLFSTAALVVACAVGALATSQLPFLKMLGVGLSIAVLTDAAIVRSLLVPALMGIAGQANWWAPHKVRATVRNVAAQSSAGHLRLP